MGIPDLYFDEKHSSCVRSSTFKLVSVVIRLVPSSGRSSLMSTVSTPPVPTPAPLSFSLRGSMSTTMRPLAATTCLDSLEPATTGPRVTTQKELSWLTLFSMLSEKSPSPVTVSRLPADPLPGRRHRLWDGNTPHLKDQRRVSRQNHEHILSCSFTKGVRHCCGALQRHPLSPPAGGEHRRDLLH